MANQDIANITYSNKVIDVDDLSESYALTGSVRYPHGKFHSDITEIGKKTLDNDYVYGLNFPKEYLDNALLGPDNMQRVYDTPVYGSNVFIDGIRRTKFDHVDKNQTQINGHDIYLKFRYKTGELGISNHVNILNIDYNLSYNYYDKDTKELLTYTAKITGPGQQINTIDACDNKFSITNTYTVSLSGPSVTGPLFVNNENYLQGDYLNNPHYDLSTNVTYLKDTYLTLDDIVDKTEYDCTTIINNVDNEYIGKPDYTLPSTKYINIFEILESGNIGIKIRSNYDFNYFNLFNIKTKVNPLSVEIKDNILNNIYTEKDSYVYVRVLEGNDYSFDINFNPEVIDTYYDDKIYCEYRIQDKEENNYLTTEIIKVDNTFRLIIHAEENVTFNDSSMIQLNLHYPLYNDIDHIFKINVYHILKLKTIYLGAYYPNMLVNKADCSIDWQKTGWHKYKMNDDISNSEEYIIHDYDNNSIKDAFDKEFRTNPLYIAVPKDVKIYPCCSLIPEDHGLDLNSFKKTYINVKFINSNYDHLTYNRKYVLYIDKEPSYRYYTNKLKYIK